MNRLTLLICSLALLVSSLAKAAEPLTVEAIRGGHYRGKSVPAFRSTADGKHYTAISADGRAIVKYQYSNGHAVDTLLNLNKVKPEEGLDVSSLKLSGYAIPAIRDTRLYKCQTCVCNASEERDLVAVVDPMRQDPNVLVLRNVSSGAWDAVTSNGTNRRVPPGAVIPLKEGISFKANSETITIVKNKLEQGA